MRVSPEDVAGFAVGAGFKGEALRTAVAVSFAENASHDTAARGDGGLVTATWGPSIGLWQIRSLKRDYGTGRERDEKALDNPSFNATAAYKISKKGTDWTPWSVYTSGAYRSRLADADAAIAKNGGRAAATVGDPDIPQQIHSDVGRGFDIGGSIANAVSALNESAFKAGRNVLAVVVALVLLILGVLILVRAPIGRIAKRAAGAAAGAAKATPAGRAGKAVQEAAGQ